MAATMTHSPESRVARHDERLTTSQPNRRQFLQAGVAAMALAFGQRLRAQELEPRDVNDHLHRIPRKLPHVVRRREDLYDGASHGLIVIPQIHYADDLDDEGILQVDRNQKEIHELVQALLRGKWIDSIHAEGMMADGEPSPDPRYAYRDEHSYAARTAPPLVLAGADRQLAKEGRLILKGAEKTKEYDASGPALSMRKGAMQRRLLYEDREDALLDIVIRSRDAIACTVYGCAHDWEPNVENLNLEEWNKEHPEHIVSLLTLTTKTIADYKRNRYRPKPRNPSVPRNLDGNQLANDVEFTR